MGGSLGYEQSQSQQNSQSNAGISGAYKDRLSADAYGENQALGTMARGYADSPFGYFQGRHVSELFPTTNGLPTAFTQYMNQAAGDMFSKASAGGASRGQLTPDSTPAVVGSAITNLGAQALPYVMQTQQYLTQLPDQLAAQRLGYLQASQAAKASLLGSSSTYSGNSSGFGFRVAGGVGGGMQ